MQANRQAIRRKRIDIEITGQGFYQIQALTKRAIAWMQAVQGFDGHATYYDDQRLTRDIADGAICNGLRVTVNGQVYLGNGYVEA